MKNLILNLVVATGCVLLVGCGNTVQTDSAVNQKPPENIEEIVIPPTETQTTETQTTTLTSSAETTDSSATETSDSTSSSSTNTTVTTTVAKTTTTTAKVTTKAATQAATKATTKTTTVVTTTTVTTTTAPPVTTSVNPIPPEIIINNVPTVEVYSDITIGNLITESNIMIEEPNTLVDTSYIGDKSVDVKCVTNIPRVINATPSSLNNLFFFFSTLLTLV